MKVTTEQMAAHVEALVARHEIWITERTSPSIAWALSETLEIAIPHVRGVLTYATALHELGHCLGRYQSSRSVLTVERWAWHWARENALIWTASMERSAQRDMAWYEARAPWPPRVVHGPPGCQRE